VYHASKHSYLCISNGCGCMACGTFYYNTPLCIVCVCVYIVCVAVAVTRKPANFSPLQYLNGVICLMCGVIMCRLFLPPARRAISNQCRHLINDLNNNGQTITVLNNNSCQPASQRVLPRHILSMVNVFLSIS